MINATCYQQQSYNRHVQQRSFKLDDTVWLDIPTTGKLDPKWQWGWMVKAIQGQTTCVITGGKLTELCT